MNKTITNKMKDSVLRTMLEIYRDSNSTATPIEYEFLLTNLNFRNKLPMIEKGLGSHLVDIVKHLESEGFVRKDQLRFYFTEAGLSKAKDLNQSTSASTHTTQKKPINWQNSIIIYIFIGVLIVVLGGLILNAIIK